MNLYSSKFLRRLIICEVKQTKKYFYANSESFVNLVFEDATNLAVTRSPAQFVSTRLVENSSDWERVQAVLTVPSTTRTFLRLKVT